MIARFLCLASFLSAASAKDEVTFPPFRAPSDRPDRVPGLSPTLSLLES